MLHKLYRYANDHDLTVKYGFKVDKCKWVIDLDENGEFFGLRKIDREFFAPKYPSNLMNAGGRTHFILEAFNKIESDYFADLAEQVSEVEPRFRAVSAFLHNETQQEKLKENFDAQKVKPTEKTTFAVNGEYLVNLTSWQDWWQEHVRKQGGGTSEASDMLCLMGGVPTAPIASHNKINISRAGGISTGSVLIGFDKAAFTSYGLEASKNAAMSENAVLTYTTVLDHMIQNAAKPLGNVLFLHGYDNPIPQDDDIFALAEEINVGDDKTVLADAERRLKELIDAVRSGKYPQYLQNRYYVFMVTGASGRVMMRDYLEGDCEELVNNFDRWFSDLSLVALKGNGDANTPKLSGMLTRLVSFRENDSKVFQRIGDELSPIIPAIWRSVLTGTPLSDTIAAKALAHMRSRLLKTENSNPDTIACMWLKIWLTRGGVNMTKGLNRDEMSQAYHMGRLLAVYAKLQEDANPGVNVGVGQRYFASASTTPALVLGRLATLSNHHLAKLSEGGAVWYKQQLQEVASNICTELPSVMSLKDQSLFALGYYHQMAEFYKVKSSKNEEE